MRCEMKMTSLPSPASCRGELEQPLGLAGGSAEVASSRMRMRGSLGQPLGDLDDLPLGQRQPAHLLVGAQRRESVALEQLQRLAPQRPRASTVPSGVSGSCRNQMFCSTVRSGMSDSSWNTAAMPARLRGVRVGGPEGSPSTRIAARVVADGAGEDLDEGALAGAVLAEQRVHLAGARRGTRLRSARRCRRSASRGRGVDQVHGSCLEKNGAPGD